MNKDTLKGIQGNVDRAEKTLEVARQAISDARAAQVDPERVRDMERRYDAAAARVRAMRRVYGGEVKTEGA